ncbi:MAG: efflux RND transporter permease subunit [Prolixibacteraceae bacterium]|nr:efflux RND transporter permease subunit [Prolixibacteraceae bacterium]
MNITDISIKRTTIPVVIFTILALAGIYSYTRLNVELIPNIDIPVNVVMTVYPGAAPSEVESSVTKPIEDAVSGMEGIDKLNSYSFENMSIVVIQLKDDMDADISLQDCERKVNMIQSELPEDTELPRFMKMDMNMMPIMSIAASSDMPEQQFYDLIDLNIVPYISQIKGVAQVEIIGGNQREIQIKADAQKLQQYGISLSLLKQMITASNLDFPVGNIKDDQTRSLIRLSGKFTSVDEIKELILRTSANGSTIKVKDVATVVDGNKESTKMARINGTQAIGLSVTKQSGANAVEISDETHKLFKEIETKYADQNLKFIIASDSSEFTKDAVNSVMVDLIFAIILVSITMLLFLHSFRNLLFVVVSIPTSIVSTFVAFMLFGFSLNLLTLLAMSIVVGVIVDDAIVVLENIYRHMEEGKNRWQASLDATKELGITVVSITIVLIAVFLPIGLSGGITGELLRSFSMVIVFSILISLLVSFTLVPLLTSRFGKIKILKKNNLLDRLLMGFESVINGIKSYIMSALHWALGHKTITLVSVVLLLVASFSLVSKGYIQTEFMDAGDNGEFIMKVELEKNATLDETAKMCAKVEERLLQFPEVELLFTKVGSEGGSMSFNETPNVAEINVKLVDKKKRDVSSKVFSIQAKNAMAELFAGPKFTVNAVSIMGTTTRPLELIVRGNNYEEVKQYAAKVLEVAKKAQGTTDVESSDEEGNMELNIEIDRDKLAKMGLTLGEVGAELRIAFAGDNDLKYKESGEEYDINIMLDEFNKKSKDDVENMSLITRTGSIVKLKQIASVTEKKGPAMLTRFNKLPAVSITGQVAGNTIGTIGEEIQTKLEQIEKPIGVDVVYAGDLENQTESFGSLLIALIASILLVYLTMVALYDSYAYPFVVMFSMPLSIIGALLALALAGKSMSLFSIMGIIMLMGLVAKNAILVVDFANDLVEKGHKVYDAIVEATSLRFRPILMTNLALIFGLLPLALSSGAGAEWKSGIGWVLIGGLISSMFLSLIIIPVIYVLVSKMLKKDQMNEKKRLKEIMNIEHVLPDVKSFN